MAKLKFNNGKVEEYSVILSTRDYRHLGQLYGLKEIKNTENLNGADEFSFTIYKHNCINSYDEAYNTKLQEYRNYLWDNVVDLKLIYIKEINEYFEIHITRNDSADTYKTITAKSLCESELSEVNMYSFEANTEADIERDNYEITTFYNPSNPKSSLLNRVLDYAPQYKIKHVDASLCDIQRMFSIDGSSVYDFLTGECSEQFDCLFQFDSTDRSISVYDLMSVCNDCGERGEFDVCPECGSTNLKYFGNDTGIYVDKTNLSDEITLECNDTIKNCFKLEAGDDIITSAVISLNQNGTDRIYRITDEQKKDMPKELVARLESYDKLYDSYTEEYEKLLLEKYEALDQRAYYQSSMMPTVENAEVTAQTEADKLISMNLSPLGLSAVTKATSLSTVNSALRNYAKVYVKTGYVKIEVMDDAEFTYLEQDTDGFNYGNWYGRFKVTNYSDEEDIAYTSYMTIKVYDNYEDFVSQKVLKNIASNDDDENSVFDVLAIDELEDFQHALTLYSMNRLVSFRDAIQGAIDTLIASNEGGDEDSELYKALYEPYYNKLLACEEEIAKRQETIDEIQNNIDNLDLTLGEIQSELNFKEYLGEYYDIFCSYKREDKYSNSNYISDGLDENVEVIDKAKEFLEVARKELTKASEYQYTLSSTLKNLLVMNEFKPIADQFELGNWFRFKVDGQLYKLRLISYTIDFDNLQTISVEFSTITKIDNFLSDSQSVISSAQSIAKSYGSVAKQAENGNTAKSNISEWIESGLNSALINIKSSDNVSIEFNNRGILGRHYDDILGDYDDEQLIITNNIMGFTNNKWKTCSLAIGKHNYTYYDEDKKEFLETTDYGVSAKFMQAGYVNGSQIIGGDIYSDNYNQNDGIGTHINLREGTANFGNKLTWDGKLLTVSGDIKGCNIAGGTINSAEMQSGSIKIGSNFSVDSSGNMVANNAKLTGNINAAGANITGNIYANYLEANTGGKIGGWTIGATTLSAGNVILNSSGDLTGVNWNITNAGKASFSNVSVTGGSMNWGNFSVSSGGTLTVTNANIKGNSSVAGLITASKFKFDDSAGHFASMGHVTQHTILSGLNLSVTGGLNFRSGASSSYEGTGVASINSSSSGGITYGSGAGNHVFTGGNVNVKNTLELDGLLLLPQGQVYCGKRADADNGGSSDVALIANGNSSLGNVNYPDAYFRISDNGNPTIRGMETYLRTNILYIHDGSSYKYKGYTGTKTVGNTSLTFRNGLLVTIA